MSEKSKRDNVLRTVCSCVVFSFVKHVYTNMKYTNQLKSFFAQQTVSIVEEFCKLGYGGRLSYWLNFGKNQIAFRRGYI